MSSSLTQLTPEQCVADTGPVGPSRLRSAWASVIGGRQHNEDRCFGCDRSSFYLVVDGMGGHRGGALASQIAIETIPKFFNRKILQTRMTHAGVHSSLISAISAAAKEMSTVAIRHPLYGRMGCTLAAAKVVGRRLYFTHVGDCRIYLFRRHNLQRLTKDQTLVQEMVDAGVVSVDAVGSHRWRHIVTNSVSAKGLHSRVETSYLDLMRGDRILLASDGLTDTLADTEIHRIVSGASDCIGGVQGLITEAEQCDAADNVTCILFET